MLDGWPWWGYGALGTMIGLALFVLGWLACDLAVFTSRLIRRRRGRHGK